MVDINDFTGGLMKTNSDGVPISDCELDRSIKFEDALYLTGINPSARPEHRHIELTLFESTGKLRIKSLKDEVWVWNTNLKYARPTIPSTLPLKKMGRK